MIELEIYISKIRFCCEVILILEFIFFILLPSAEYMILVILATFSLYLPFICFDYIDRYCRYIPKDAIII